METWTYIPKGTLRGIFDWHGLFIGVLAGGICPWNIVVLEEVPVPLSIASEHTKVIRRKLNKHSLKAAYLIGHLIWFQDYSYIWRFIYVTS